MAPREEMMMQLLLSERETHMLAKALAAAMLIYAEDREPEPGSELAIMRSIADRLGLPPRLQAQYTEHAALALNRIVFGEDG